jgi:phosphate-selective porin OprO/OprP
MSRPLSLPLVVAIALLGPGVHSVAAQSPPAAVRPALGRPIAPAGSAAPVRAASLQPAADGRLPPVPQAAPPAATARSAPAPRPAEGLFANSPPVGAGVAPAGAMQLASTTSQPPSGPSVEERLAALEARTAPKPPMIKLGGFFQLDHANFSQSLASRRTYGDMEDGTGFRRARLQAYGSLSEFTNYILEMDFATAGRPSFMDVWGEQTNLGWLGTVRVGHFRQPTTMDALTSVRHLEFMERSDAFQAFDPFRRVGVMSYDTSEDRNTTWAGSVYSTGFTFLNPIPTGNTEQYGTLGDTRNATFVGDNGGVSTAWRGTHLLWYDEPADGRYLMHVGGGYNYSSIGGNGGPPGPTNGRFYIARTIPGVFVGDPLNAGVTASGTPFVANTGNIPARNFHLFHLEWAGQYGAAHFQTEWLGTVLDTTTVGTIFLNGMYAQAGYFLTGEHCPYNRQFGVLDYNVKPFTEFFGLGKGKGVCGWGAWEVAARYDFLNLPNAGFAPPPAAAVLAGTINAGTAGGNPNPGTLNMATFALNWWWNQYARMQFNYINVWQDSDFAIFGKSYTGVFASRFQIEF